MRINKFLASTGLGSRRKVEELVTSGKISVNGKIVRDLSTDIGETDVVEFNGKTLLLESEKVYIMLNKPKCYVTTLSDEKGRKIVLDLIRDSKVRVFPVGRLDYNTRGLLILTNDGDFANSIIHPSKHIPKTYQVKLKYMLTTKEQNQIRRGMVLDDMKTLPAKVDFVGMDDEYYLYNVTIFEGKNREIRKMFEALNLKIYDLIRLSIGGLDLGDLKEGKYRYLKAEDINKIFVGE